MYIFDCFYRLKTDGYYMCRSQLSWFRCRLMTKINLITNEDNLVTVHLIDWGMERQVAVSGQIQFKEMMEFDCFVLFQIFEKWHNRKSAAKACVSLWKKVFLSRLLFESEYDCSFRIKIDEYLLRKAEADCPWELTAMALELIYKNEMSRLDVLEILLLICLTTLVKGKHCFACLSTPHSIVIGPP